MEHFCLGISSNIQRLRVAFDEDRIPNLYEDKLVLQVKIHSHYIHRFLYDTIWISDFFSFP